MIELRKSNRADKKYMMIFDNKTIHFGSSQHSDFTIHKNEKRKLNYLNRHRKRENWTDIETAGALSRWILWNLPTLKESIRDTEKRFRIKINSFI
tara:strand:+ start:295 stop:579 length:285 start_codon:yes stop_codon:yes gene_type:complete